MIRRALIATCALAVSTTGCNKWIGMSSEKKPRQTAEGNPTVRPAPASGLEPPPKGHIRITVKLIKNETQAWFKNCLSFRTSGELSQEVRVGCNKRQPGERFLEQEIPYDFEVSKGSEVNVTFTFETWKSSSSCITYSQCENPYPGSPQVRTITGPVQAARCYRAGTRIFRLFYEDQPDENHLADTRIRSKLTLENENVSPESFSPANPADLNTRYRKRSDASFDLGNPLEACVAQKATGDYVTEGALQDCLGIDHGDFIVEVESADASIRIGEFTDDRCKPL